MSLPKEHLLAEVEDLLRSMPPDGDLGQNAPSTLAWLGRLRAVIEEWSMPKMIPLNAALNNLRSSIYRDNGVREIAVLLHQAQHNLRLHTLGPSSSAISKGMVFAYFDELRKIIELARQDLLFVDPYLDAEFVSQYLPYAKPGVTLRLLTEKKLKTLLPALDAYCRQNSAAVSVRSTLAIHDRYVFVDGATCYQSGSSFKDGAKTAGTVITQIVDAFGAMKSTYDALWSAATIQR